MPSRHGIEPWIGGLLACGVAWASWSALAHGATLSVANREYLLRLRLLTLCFAVLTVVLSFVCSLFSGIVVLS